MNNLKKCEDCYLVKLFEELEQQKLKLLKLNKLTSSAGSRKQKSKYIDNYNIIAN